MFKNVTPESVGISSKFVLEFYKNLDDYKLATHSIIMAKGNDIFTECYYAPFNKDFKHRMYSVSKSFVSVAIGLAVEDGLLSLEDKFIDFFPDYINENVDERIREVTIRDMLRMETGHHYGMDWFRMRPDDRAATYFSKSSDKIPGTMFSYDSSASYMLNVIVEKLVKKPFLEYLKERFLVKSGFSEDAYCLQAPGGHSFGDSGVMCTARDMLTFARFVMNKGTWDGVRYMNKEYLDAATSKQVDNNPEDMVGYDCYGYGYQIWKAPNDGFAFVGMGDQFAVCDVNSDVIFIINSDNQGNGISRNVFYHGFYNTILKNLGEPLPEDPDAYKELTDYINSRKLKHMIYDGENEFEKKIDGVKYILEENPMGIEYVKISFDGKKGTLTYKNAQGEKQLFFGMGYNEFGKFPQEGYSDMVVTVFEKGHYYNCACSAAWVEPQKLNIKVQIIDKYFGNGSMTFSFKDDRICVWMTKVAEDFMNEYCGLANGKAEK